MVGSRFPSSWFGRLLVLALLGSFTAVVVARDLRGERSAPALDFAILALVWGSFLLDAARKLRGRSSGRFVPEGVAAPSEPDHRSELPNELRQPPPRSADSSHLVRGAVSRYRVSLFGLVLCAAPPVSTWLRHGDGKGTMIAGILGGVMGLGLVLFVESNVRAIRRLVRDGTVVYGEVCRILNQRGGAFITVEYPVDGRRLRVSPLTQGVGLLQRGMTVPVLMIRGSSLAGVVVDAEQVAVGRARTRWALPWSNR